VRRAPGGRGPDQRCAADLVEIDPEYRREHGERTCSQHDENSQVGCRAVGELGSGQPQRPVYRSPSGVFERHDAVGHEERTFHGETAIVSQTRREGDTVAASPGLSGRERAGRYRFPETGVEGHPVISCGLAPRPDDGIWSCPRRILEPHDAQ
jgi:hypothetical protein